MPRSKDGGGGGSSIVWRKYFLPKGGRCRMGGQLGLMLPTRRRRSQWWEPFLCCAPPRWISAWWLCYRNAAPTHEQNHHQRATNAVSTFLHIQHQVSQYFHHHHNLHPTHHNSHLCHHICHIINITRYQSTWWDFANLIVNPHLTHSLIPLQMALMSRCHLIQLQQTIHNQPMAGYFIQRDIFPPVQCIIKIVVKIHANFSKMC